MEREELKEILKEAMREQSRVDAETHREDHEFIAELRKERKERRAFWDKVKKSAVGVVTTVIVGKLFFVFFWIGDLVLDHFLKKGGH